MNINKTYAQTKWNISNCGLRQITYIVIHNTATDANAEANCRYFTGVNRNASADFFMNKDGSIYQFNADPNNYYSWHCGDGKGKYGITNKNSIGIEVVSACTTFTDAQIIALRELISHLKASYGCSEVVRHYDASRKSCPMAYIDNAKWNELKSAITSSHVETQQPKSETGYRVKVNCSVLNVRMDASSMSPISTQVKRGEVYTIVDTKNGYGKLKSGAGWICLKYTVRV